MKKLVLGTLLTFSVFFAKEVQGQYYSYGFNGAVKDSAALHEKIQNIDNILTSKLRVKEDVQKGEVLFEIAPYKVQRDERGRVISRNELVQLKALLLREGLEPIELIKLKN